jgi:succinate dehydrogenase / fumarate reductase cytochrome b subunit
MSLDTRPVYLNLLRIRMPAGAVASILHRVSGVLLVLTIPFGIYLLQLSLSGEAGFAAARALLDTALVKAVSVVLLWAVLHHLLVGIRHLLIDLELGVRLPTARRSAWGTTLGAALLTAVIVAGAAL